MLKNVKYSRIRLLKEKYIGLPVPINISQTARSMIS